MTIQPFPPLGKYQLLAKIGEGGFGIVYKARDPMLDRDVAIKVLRSDLASAPDFVERFRREARLAASLRHQNIVTVIEVGEQDGRYYIVMEYLEGQSLADLLKDGKPLPLNRAVELLRPLAEALDYAHSRGIIHRDVKPGNVLLADGGKRPVLTDFGLVKSTTEVGTTTTGIVLGTAEYMAPEQITGKEPTPATDLYALGVIAYQMLTGRAPFTGTTPFEVQNGHVNQQPPDPRKFNPIMTEELAGVLLRALRKIPEQRYPNGAAFAQALAEIIVREEERYLHEQYTQAENLMKVRKFSEALEIWVKLQAARPGFRDVSERITQANKQIELLKLYSETNDLVTQAQRKARKILESDPAFPDAEHTLQLLSPKPEPVEKTRLVKRPLGVGFLILAIATTSVNFIMAIVIYVASTYSLAELCFSTGDHRWLCNTIWNLSWVNSLPLFLVGIFWGVWLLAKFIRWLLRFLQSSG